MPIVSVLYEVKGGRRDRDVRRDVIDELRVGLDREHAINSFTQNTQLVGFFTFFSSLRTNVEYTRVQF